MAAMILEKDVSLLNYNTFGIDVKATNLIVLKEPSQLESVFAQIAKAPYFLLGGGSNVLFTQDFDGYVVKNEISGIQVVEESADSVIVEAGAGEVWHEFVMHCLSKGWYGLENLSLIPGTVGASPIQNIGAYGVEAKDCFSSVTFYQISKNKLVTYNNEDCNFGYRESVFKHDLKGDFVITSVRYKLSKVSKIEVTYGAIKEVLSKMGIDDPTPIDVSNAVISIRESKLPDPKKIGNGGSFFKNPVIPTEQFLELQKKFPNIVSYPVDENLVKVPAGWLIDQAGWKGKTIGNVGVHKNQALVLVNYGGGTGLEVKSLAAQVIESVESIYGIRLTPEINIL